MKINRLKSVFSLNGERIILRILNAVCILAICILAGYFLQVLAYSIPVQWMQAQKIETAEIMNVSDTREMDSATGRTIDNYADSMTIALATYEGEESAFEKAANSYYMGIQGLYPRETLIETTLHHEQGERWTYARYWHGSMLFVKPLMLIFNISEIRVANTVCLLVLVMLVLFLMQRRLPGCTIPFALMMRRLDNAWNIPAHFM